MEIWKRKRTQYRREFTSLADKTVRAVETNDEDVGQLFDLLSEAASSLFEAEAAVRDLWCAAEDFDEALYQADQEKAMNYKIRWHKVRSMFSNKLPRIDSASSLHSAESSNKPKSGKQRLPSLPKLELIKFDGNVKSWLLFWGQFKKIHKDPAMDSSDKFQYLLQSMTLNSSARQLVESYPPCAENYGKAVEALKARFARDDVLIETYVRGLLSLMQRKEEPTDLSNLYDSLQTHLQALDTLGVTKDKYASMLFPMIESALPENILRAWHRSRPDARDLTSLMQFLRQEVESEERIRLARYELVETKSEEPRSPTACFVAETKRSKEGFPKQTISSCVWCGKDGHSAVECYKAAKMTIQERADFIKAKKVCSICLKSNHIAKKCKSFPKCLFCKKRHFTIMCADIAADSCNKQEETSSNLSCQLKTSTTTLLQTLVVKVVHGKKEVFIRALVDSGAQRSYLKKDSIQKLGLKPSRKEVMTHCLFGGFETKEEECQVFDICVKNIQNNFCTNLSVVEQTNICGFLPKIKSTVIIEQLRQNNITLNDSMTDSPNEVSLLIGADFSGLLLTGDVIQLENNLTAINTKLGWTVQGSITGVYSTVTNSTTTLHCLTKIDVTDLWTLEAIGIRDPAVQATKSARDEEILKSFRDNIKVNEEGRYEVSLPWRDVPRPQTNYGLAKKRMDSTMTRLKQLGKLNDYDNAFREWLELNIIEEAPDQSIQGHYLAHHPVIKESNLTTRIRPVFDGSARDGNGISLNSCLEKGMNLLEQIPNLLIDFRKNKIGVTADIAKAFLQISLVPEDRDYLRFLWWSKMDEEGRRMITYRHRRVVFGVKSSPFHLVATINHHLDTCAERFRETAMKLKKSFYVDNCVTSLDSEEELEKFMSESKEVMLSETEGVSSGCEASGFRDEIARDYAALQTRLGREISDRRGKLHSGPARPVPTREQLSADFQKKLDEWQMLKGMQPPPFVPERKDLSEDFLKKWDAWNRMKETNSVPSWGEQSKPDQVLVQTSTGLFKFQGISRSFTRKLHEWEKSRGIAPEASTSALLRAARARSKAARASPAQLTRTQSDGSVAPSMASGHLHASSLSVNDADDFESEYEREEHSLVDDDEPPTRGAVLVEVEAEEVCTAAPLVAVSPRPAPQQPVYSYGLAEARLLCETSSAAVTQPNEGSRIVKSNGQTGSKPKTSREQSKPSEKSNRRKMTRQPSIEEDAKFIRKTIEEIERGSSNRFKEEKEGETEPETQYLETASVREEPTVFKAPQKNLKQTEATREKTKSKEDIDDAKEDKRKDESKSNGKKKSKSRARLEREQSKPSESDTEQDVDTVTVEIPRRRKRPRRASERPRTPPTSLHSDSEGEVFVLKLQAPGPRDCSPEVIVKTTRKIFSPVVRSGESVPRAVIPVNVEDLDDVRPSEQVSHRSKHKAENRKAHQEMYARSKSSGDLQESEEQRPTSRPPLPTSPSSQRKPQPKETAPSIRIMIQRYNMKINEEGHTSPVSSGASSPAWRSPALERRRPPDMPVGVNIRNNPFLEREVQKSASACQLSRRDQNSVEKRLTPVEPAGIDGVLKSRSANALHPELPIPESPPLEKEMEDSQETIKCTTASTDTIVPDLTRNLPETKPNPIVETTPMLRQMSEIVVPSITKIVKENPALFARSVSTVEPVCAMEVEAAQLSERTARIRAARERFLSSPIPMRREGTSSASDLRPGDRSSRISCESDVTESQSSGAQESILGRSASTGMVNVDQESWQRVAEGGPSSRPRSRFSLARLAARWRRKEGAVSRLCRQSLLVHLPNKH